jgi:acyl carrier protein
MSQLNEESVRRSILGFLAPKLGQSGPAVIDEDENLMEGILSDSAELLELVVWVEEKVNIEFNPDGLNLEDGLTIRQLIGAFDPAKANNGTLES